MSRRSLGLGLTLISGLWWWLPSPKLEPSPRPPLTGQRLALPPSRKLTARGLNELSGLAQSRRYPGVLWAHNDSLDKPRLFAIDQRGALLSEHRVEGAQNVDWEDLALADGPLEGLLLIGDTGNNFHWRDELSVYVVREPTPGYGGAVKALGRIRYRFPDQRRRPPQTLEGRCRDAEAIFWAEGALYLIAKCFWGGRAPLYRIPVPSAELQRLAALKDHASALSVDEIKAEQPPLTLEWVTTLAHGQPEPPFAWRVTAADYNPARQQLAVLSYHGVGLYPWPLRIHRGEVHPLGSWRFPSKLVKQVEAITWLSGAKRKVMIGNEQRSLWELPLP